MATGISSRGHPIPPSELNCWPTGTALPTEKRPEVRRLMTHPGVGALTALAFMLIIGTPERFGCGKQVTSYLGLVPSEKSSGNRRRLGHITKQGSSMLRFLLVEAAQVTVRSDPSWPANISTR